MFDFLTKPVQPLRTSSGLLPYGRNKSDGSHDHRSNRGGDRTPAQREGDRKRTRDGGTR